MTMVIVNFGGLTEAAKNKFSFEVLTLKLSLKLQLETRQFTNKILKSTCNCQDTGTSPLIHHISF